MKDIRLGDRFKTGLGNIVEVVGLKGCDIKFKAIEITEGTTDYENEGDVFVSHSKPNAYKFIGNFGKSSNFRDIYDILNEP